MYFYLSIAVMLLCISCSSNKDVKLVGFAYRDERITLEINNERVYNLKAGGNPDENRLCSFYEIIAIESKEKDIKLNLSIDSNNTKLLDTVIFINRNNKEPIISFAYPSKEIKYKRHVFILDEADSSFIKY